MSIALLERNRELRVALVYDDSMDRDGGVPQYVTSLTRGLQEQGHRVSLLVGESGVRSVDGASVHSLARNVRVRFNGNRLSMPMASRSSAIDRVMAAGQFDVVHVQVPYSPLMASRVIARAAPGTAVVGTFHVASERWLPRVGSRLLAAVTQGSLGRFDRMISVSGCAAEFARSTYGVESQIVPNMIDVERIQRLAEPGRGSTRGPTIAYLGALVRRKGPGLLLEAFLRLRRRVPSATLAIAGEGPLRGQLERRVRIASAGDAVRILGRVDERRKAELLGAAQVACFPSRYGESFGIVLLEAIAAGAGAVLAGENCGYAELFSSCPQAVCDTAPETLCQHLEHLLVNPERRARLGAAQRHILGQHRPEDVTRQILGVYADALSARNVAWRPQTSRGEVRAGLA